MPVYNASAYIEESIASVLSQSFPDFELLIIDDGSTDDSPVKISQFNDPRIYFFQQKNEGVSSARNVGLMKMQGDFFCFLDADDVLPKNSIKDRFEKLIQNSEIEFVDGKVEIFDASLEKKIQTYTPQFKGNPLSHLFSLSEKCFFGQTWMIRRKKGVVYKFNEMLSHGEDLLFYMEQSRRGGLYDYVVTPILFYRKHETSAMRKTDRLLEGYKKLYSILKLWPEFTSKHKFIFLLKLRKVMMLEYVHQKKYKSAFLVLFS
jgi:glycosyltransferase involved in cell wall biosynthesis